MPEVRDTQDIAQLQIQPAQQNSTGNGPHDRSQPTHHDHCKKHDTHHHGKNFRLDKPQHKGIQATADTGIKGAQSKGEGLEVNDIDPDVFRSDIGVSDGDKCPPHTCFDNIAGCCGKNDGQGNKQEVEITVRVEMPGTNKQIRGMQSLTATEDIQPADNAGNGQSEAQCSDGQIGPFEPKGRQAD